MLWFCDNTFRKEKLYAVKIEIYETDGKDGHYIVLKIDEIQEILIVEREKGTNLV